MNEQQRLVRNGYIAAIAAGLIWGLLPLYIHLLGNLSPLWFVAQRILWSLLFVAVIIIGRREIAAFFALLRTSRVVKPMSISAALIVLNWATYVYAVSLHHILAASLGFFLNPLVSVLLGVVFLGERLNRMQWVAVIVAFSGAALLAVSALDTLWISLTLALTFALYGFVRKTAPIEALPGLAMETLMLAPFALAYLLVAVPWPEGTQPLPSVYWLLPLSGVLTSVPLLLFSYSARRLTLTTLGLLQYLAPSMQFLIGLIVFDEPFNGAKLVSFLIVWTGLAIYTWDLIRRAGIARSSAISR